MVIKNDILNKIALQKSTFSALILIRNGYGTRKEKKVLAGFISRNIISNLSQLSLCSFEENNIY